MTIIGAAPTSFVDSIPSKEHSGTGMMIRIIHSLLHTVSNDNEALSNPTPVFYGQYHFSIREAGSYCNRVAVHDCASPLHAQRRSHKLSHVLAAYKNQHHDNTVLAHKDLAHVSEDILISPK